MKQTKSRYILLLVMMFVMLAAPHGARAQQNEYGISPRLYTIYQEANKQRFTRRGVQLADSMRLLARRMGDHTAELLSMTIPMRYHFGRKDDERKFFSWVKTIQRRSREYNNSDYYYYAMTNKVYYLVAEKRFQEAVDYLREEGQYDKNKVQPYGIYLSYNMLGVIYRYRGDYSKALDNFQQAKKYAQQKLPEVDLEPTYREICTCYRKTMQFGKLLAEINSALPREKSKKARATLVTNKCYALFMLSRKEEFRQTYRQFEQFAPNLLVNVVRVANAIRTFKQMADGQMNEAWINIQSLRDPDEKAMATTAYYIAQKDFAKAKTCLMEIFRKQQEANQTDVEGSLQDIAAQVERKVIASEKTQADSRNAQLALQHAQLQLRNASLELDRSRDAEQLAKTSAEKNLLSLHYQQLLSQQLQDSLKTQRYKQEVSEQKMEGRNSMLLTTLVVSILFSLLAILYLRHNRKLSHKLRDANRQLQQTHHQLEQANEAAQEADRMKTLFVQNMSHEIRTPLNAIVGFSGVLTDMDDAIGEEEKLDLNRRISQNSELLSTLVNDILDLTSIESGRYVMKMECVNIHELCSEAFERLHHPLTDGVEMHCEILVSRNADVTTDRQRTCQVVTNMLSNAVKNTTKGSITLRVEPSGNSLSFVVTDTGIGVPPEHMETIFERFRKLDAFKQGSGLGLYICRTIAQKLGGTIDIDRNYTGGARFCFRIPWLQQ